MNPQGVEIRPIGAEHDGERDEFVRAAPDSGPFHLSHWRRVIGEVFGHSPRELGAFRDGRLVGVLPLIRVPSLLGRANHVSVPYGTYGGPLALEPEISQALVRRALERAREEGVGRLELRYQHPPGELEGFVASDLYWTFLRDLPEDPAEVLARMPKKARAEARKAAERHGLRLVEGRWYVDDLYRMFLENKRALGSPALPARLFHALLETYGDGATVHLVVRERRPLAAVMSFLYRDTLIAYYSGTAPGADRNYSASNFMYMALQTWAAERGFRRFDFCRSRGDSGAFRFKQHQGFEPQPLPYRYALVRAKGLPSFTPSNPRTRILRDAWSRLPSSVVGRISPLLARYLG